MKKRFITCISLFIFSGIYAQTQNKISAYLSPQQSLTIYDRTEGNNPWSIGLGFQTLYNNRTRFKPAIELTVDGAIADDKIYRTDSHGQEVQDADVVINLFAGTAFNFSQQLYISFLCGPSFINSNTHFGIKPSIAYYFSKNQRFGLRAYYVNIFNREPNYEETKMQDFGSIGLAFNIKLF